ncbi:hypothetical protein E306M_06730 [Moorella sp. E306M]|nr:hypothetical protein E306M_06730 [Moorella sp. E306M]
MCSFQDGIININLSLNEALIILSSFNAVEAEYDLDPETQAVRDKIQRAILDFKKTFQQ